MSAEVGVAYARPERPELINLAGFLIAIMLCLVGVVLIYHGVGAAGAMPEIITSMGLLAAGCLLMFAGFVRAWPGRISVNIGLFFIGLVCLVASGVLLAAHVAQAVYAIVLTGVGIVLVVVGVQLGKESWKKFLAR